MPVLQRPATSFARVLVASDLSPESELALRYAKGLVRSSAGTLLLLHVAPWEPLPSSSEWSQTSDPAPRLEDERRLEALAESLHEQGFRVVHHRSTGAVGQQVARIAVADQADLIVIGTHARQGVQRLIFGSFAEEIAGLAETPLLIVGPMAVVPQGEQWMPRRILCCVPADREEQLIEYACGLAASYRAELSIAITGRSSSDRRWTQQQARLRQTMSPEAGARLPEQAFCLSSATPESLVSLAVAKAADLIIMGGCRAEWLSLHTGLMQQVLADARCPILTIHTDRSE